MLIGTPLLVKAFAIEDQVTKGAVAKAWAEKAIIPYLEAEHPDWNSVPALQEFLGKAGGRAKAKEAIKSALESMAWPGGL